MQIIEELQNEGFEGKEELPASLIKNNCLVIINDYATVKYKGNTIIFTDFVELKGFLKQENIIK